MFYILALIFMILGERAAILLSGFNTLPKEEREKYDRSKMSKDQRNSFAIWASIMAAGAVLSYFVTQYFAYVAFLIWIILFFSDVHLSLDKAFGKYKIK